LIPNSLQENGDPATDDGMHRVVHYPFAVNEKVLIKVGRPLHFILVLMHFFQQIKFGSSLLWNTFPIAGKPANSRKVCWKRSNRDISVSQWLV